MKVLVIGANGQIGKQAIALLKKRYYDPVAMVRDTDQVPYFEKQGVKTVLADLEKDISHALYGCNAVIFAAGSGPHTGLDKTILVDQEGAIKAVDQAERLGVDRFIMLSAMRANEPEKGPKTLVPYLYAKKRADEHLLASKLNYSIVRPGILTNEPGTGKIVAGDNISTDDLKISRADVAEVLVESLEEPRTYRNTFNLLGGSEPIKDSLAKL